jgi:hypothetical protein
MQLNYYQCTNNVHSPVKKAGQMVSAFPELIKVYINSMFFSNTYRQIILLDATICDAVETRTMYVPGDALQK